MYYLIFIPIVFFAVIMKMIFEKAGFKLLVFLLKLVIIAGVLLFAYFLADYYGYNVLEIIRNFILNEVFG